MKKTYEKAEHRVVTEHSAGADFLYKDRNQLLFFLFLFPNLQENYLSNVVCTVMDAALSCIESFMEAREQERQQLKKGKESLKVV